MVVNFCVAWSNHCQIYHVANSLYLVGLCNGGNSPVITHFQLLVLILLSLERLKRIENG